MDDGVFARNFMELHESSGKHNDSVSEGDQIFNLDEAEQESSPEETLEIEDGISAESVPHRWAGWPGDNVFRMLVPTQRVGSIIGRKGELIKKIVEETRSRIKILDGPPGEAERIVMVSAKEEPHVHLPPAVEGLLRVHRRVTDGLDRDDDDADDSSDVVPAGLTVTTRVLVAATQAGNLIGRQGATVKSIQDASNSTVKVLGIEELPMFALQDDRVIEIVGDPAAVHKALELVACQLRKFLVDRSVIPLFEKLVHVGSNWKDSAASPPHHSWGPPAQPNADYAHAQPQYMNPNDGGGYYASDMPHQHHAHHGSTPSSPPIITQHMQILLSYADAVIGASGANISYIRRGSGATVTIQETRGIPGEMTVEINGTAAQVQIAQQLIQNFMMEASAPAAQLTQGGGSAEQNYNGYGGPGQAQGSVYATTPAAQGGQAAGLGSVYGPGYGY